LPGAGANAQNIRNPGYLSECFTPASSLMEAPAIDGRQKNIIKQGLARAVATKDIYGQAFANEGIGNLYTKRSSLEKAIAAYKGLYKVIQGPAPECNGQILLKVY